MRHWHTMGTSHDIDNLLKHWGKTYVLHIWPLFPLWPRDPFAIANKSTESAVSQCLLHIAARIGLLHLFDVPRHGGMLRSISVGGSHECRARRVSLESDALSVRMRRRCSVGETCRRQWGKKCGNKNHEMIWVRHFLRSTQLGVW